VYVMVNNDSFYFAGTVEAEAELTVDFPEGYLFRDEVEVRKSYYIPKRPKKDEADGESGDAIEPNTEGEEAAAESTGEAETEATPEDVPAEEAPAPTKRKGRR